MFDIVTVSAGKDLENISGCIDSLINSLTFDKIYIITNEPAKAPVHDKVVVIDESDIIGKDSLLVLKLALANKFPERFGWYLQQFLKMQFSRTKYCEKDYLIWDADTILLKEISFIVDDKVVFTKGAEKPNKPYFENFSKLTGFSPVFDFSMISQHLYVKRNVMISLLEHIENKNGHEFVSSIMFNLEGHTPSLFSEYETYTNYFASLYPGEYVVTNRVWFRNAASVVGFNASISDLNKMFSECDYVALEKFDLYGVQRLKGFFKYLIFKLKKYQYE